MNECAARYDPGPIKRLTALIRQQGGYYTVLRPGSAADLLDAARIACGLKKGRHRLPSQSDRRGKVTGLVACGGDGTFNLTARAALEADLPLGILPMGRFNNIAASFGLTSGMREAISKIVGRAYHKVDTGMAAGQLFFGSVGLGLIPRMARLLEGKSGPRYAIGWSRLASQAVTAPRAAKTIVKVDSFRFEIAPTILNINLLPYALGLPLTPASLFDDGRAEVVFDVDASSDEVSSFIRQTFRRKHIYGQSVRLFRGSVITLQNVRNRTLYLDGELLDVPASIVEIEIAEKQLKVYS